MCIERLIIDTFFTLRNLNFFLHILSYKVDVTVSRNGVLHPDTQFAEVLNGEKWRRHQTKLDLLVVPEVSSSDLILLCLKSVREGKMRTAVLGHCAKAVFSNRIGN